MKILLRNPACLIGVLLVVLHLVVAIGAPWVAPGDRKGHRHFGLSLR